MASYRLWPECVLRPSNSDIVTFRAVEGNDVESNRRIRELRVTAKVGAGRAHKLALLLPVDREGGIGETIGFTVADLDEYQALTVSHDQVDLAMPTAEIRV
jgi:hypothetical protein